MAILDANADPELIRNTNVPQGMATEWLLNNDSFMACPGIDKVLQRWVLAVTYFASGGDAWVKCSNNFAAVDPCGGEAPFLGKTRFLSASNECDWAGITCQPDPNDPDRFCVTEIEFGM